MSTSTELEPLTGSKRQTAKETVESVIFRIADPYFNPFPWEKSGRIYEALGVDLFRSRLISGKEGGFPDKSITDQIKTLSSETLPALRKLDVWTRKIEAGHLATIPILSLIPAIYFIGDLPIQFLPLLGAVSAVLNIQINIYPIMLQRYNRARIQRSINYLKRRQKRSSPIDPEPDSSLL